MLKRLIAITAASIMTTIATADAVTTFTGCLQRDKGVMYYVQEGSAPMRPCEQGDRIISFNQTGPHGPAGPSGPAAPAPPRFRFVGVTSQRFDGAGGWVAMNQACAAQYRGSRMAFTEDYRAALNPPPVPEPSWIAPHPQFQAHDGSVWDSAGTSYGDTASLDCGGWSYNGHDVGGLTLYPNGSTSASGDYCSSLHPVACAAPAP